MTTLFGGRDCYKGVTDGFPLLFFIKTVHLSVAGKQRTPHNAMLSFVQQKQEKREFMMNTSISRRQFLKASGLAAAGACAAGLLTGCGGSSSGSASGAASSGSGSSYTILYDSQPATLNYLTTGTDLEMVVGANCVDTLVEYDNKGVMREGLATSWDWDVDTLTWTFHLREENWVDCNGEVVAPVTAQDFVDALKYVLTPTTPPPTWALSPLTSQALTTTTTTTSI